MRNWWAAYPPGRGSRRSDLSRAGNTTVTTGWVGIIRPNYSNLPWTRRQSWKYNMYHNTQNMFLKVQCTKTWTGVKITESQYYEENEYNVMFGRCQKIKYLNAVLVPCPRLDITHLHSPSHVPPSSPFRHMPQTTTCWTPYTLLYRYPIAHPLPQN